MLLLHLLAKTCWGGEAWFFSDQHSRATRILYKRQQRWCIEIAEWLQIERYCWTIKWVILVEHTLEERGINFTLFTVPPTFPSRSGPSSCWAWREMQHVEYYLMVFDVRLHSHLWFLRSSLFCLHASEDSVSLTTVHFNGTRCRDKHELSTSRSAIREHHEMLNITHNFPICLSDDLA